MENFKTQVDLDISLDGYDNHDVETKKVTIRWDLELEMRNFGIKSFIVTVPEQKINVSLNIWDDNEDFGKDLVLDVKDVIVERNGNSDQLIPSILEFYQGKWKLVF